MRPNRYDELDEAIKTLLIERPRDFSDVHLHSEVRKVTRILWVMDGGLTDEFRYVDRRLQALRKKGKITYLDGKWRILPLQIAPSNA